MNPAVRALQIVARWGYKNAAWQYRKEWRDRDRERGGPKTLTPVNDSSSRVIQSLTLGLWDEMGITNKYLSILYTSSTSGRPLNDEACETTRSEPSIQEGRASERTKRDCFVRSRCLFLITFCSGSDLSVDVVVGASSYRQLILLLLLLMLGVFALPPLCVEQGLGWEAGDKEPRASGKGSLKKITHKSQSKDLNNVEQRVSEPTKFFLESLIKCYSN